VFTYTGEGQSGDMVFTRGNLVLKDHIMETCFLFESETTGFVRFKANWSITMLIILKLKIQVALLNRN
jgi:hypothetical protein